MHLSLFARNTQFGSHFSWVFHFLKSPLQKSRHNSLLSSLVNKAVWIESFQVLPGLSIDLLEEALRQSRQTNQGKVKVLA